MIRNAVLILILISSLSCKRDPGKITGIKIYDYSGDYSLLVSKWVEMGINTAFVSTTLAADKEFRMELKNEDIRVFIIFPVFQNPEFLDEDSTYYAITNKGSVARMDWVEFVCPSRIVYRNAIRNNLQEVVNSLNPDGVSIDFIRQFVYWEKIYPDRDFNTIEKACYCDSCIAGFSLINKVEIPDKLKTVAEKSIWIDKNYGLEWDDYRCSLITSMIEELSEEAHSIKRDVLVNVHIVPWRNDDFGNGAIKIAGQDLRSISKYADYVSPMCYSQMVDRDPEWISEVVKDMNTRAEGMVLPSIQVFPYYINKKFTPADFRLCMEEALKPPSQGVVFFSWPLFEKDSLRMQVVADYNEQ